MPTTIFTVVRENAAPKRERSKMADPSPELVQHMREGLDAAAEGCVGPRADGVPKEAFHKLAFGK